MSLSRYVPFGFEDDMWRGFAQDLQRMDQQMRRMTDHFNSAIVPAMAFPNQSASDVRTSEAFRMDNPIVTDKDGNQKFHLEFDLRQFKPEEITLSTENNVLSVNAKHQEESEGRMSYREYRRQYTIPEGVSLETLKSKLGHNGVLCIEAPVQKKQDVLIPITHK